MNNIWQIAGGIILGAVGIALFCILVLLGVYGLSWIYFTFHYNQDRRRLREKRYWQDGKK
jgi:hypothetical protein